MFKDLMSKFPVVVTLVVPRAQLLARPAPETGSLRVAVAVQGLGLELTEICVALPPQCWA